MLPFQLHATGGVGRLALADLVVGPIAIDKLELEVTDLGTDPGVGGIAERFQRRRTKLRTLAIRVGSAAIDERVAHVRRQLAGIGVTQLAARLNDGFVGVRCRVADGLAAADLSFRIQLAAAGAHVRALASTVRVHGHLPVPGPLIADRILSALLGATETAGVVERPHARGLCDVDIDLVGALLWHLMPPSGWRLPASSDLELVRIRVSRGAIDIAYGPAGTRPGELGVRPQTQQVAAAHDLMHSVDEQVRAGHLEDAMRGYRALLAAGGPDQPVLLERILALAAARPNWFFDGIELARQALSRWPQFPAAHAALASITLAQGDAREAAVHLEAGARIASADGDDDQAALAALAGARLLRVLDPRAATELYELALEHDPGSAEAADSLADRLADEQRWSELVRLVRARAANTGDAVRAVQLRLRLADVFVHQLGDLAGAQQELAAAQALAPDDPAVHEMTATLLATSDPPAAIEAWRTVARLGKARGDHRTCARAYAVLGGLLTGEEAADAWREALALDPLQPDALVGLATAAAARGDHALAAELFERLRGLGLPPHAAARYELLAARSQAALGRTDDARASLRRATLAGDETAAEAHALLAELAEAAGDRELAAAELDTAVDALVGLAGAAPEVGRFSARAAELAAARAAVLDRAGRPANAEKDWERAHALGARHAPAIARTASQSLLARAGAGSDLAAQRRWLDAVLATEPPPLEEARLLVRRAELRRDGGDGEVAAALADLDRALAFGLEDDGDAASAREALATRKQALALSAELHALRGDGKSRAQTLALLARLPSDDDAPTSAEREVAAASAWLAAEDPAQALPHAARAFELLAGDDTASAALRRDVGIALGEAAWRQRAWPDAIRAYRGVVADPAVEPARLGAFRYRLAVAADRTGDSALALIALEPLVESEERGAQANDIARATAPELRAQALRLFADLAERAGELSGAAQALESFASLAVDGSATARADAMYRAGELFRRAGQADDAIRCLEHALRLSDTHLPALDALEAAWRERGDHERVSVILGRKVAATNRHPARQKPLLSRLGDLQDHLGRPEVALAAHQRALEIDPTWRPSLRYVTLRLRDSGQVVAAAGGLAQLAGELSGDAGVDLAIVARERQVAAVALAVLVESLGDAQLDAVREVARPALERAALDGADVAAGLARIRGEANGAPIARATTDAETQSGRSTNAAATGRSLRDAAARHRADGALAEALATLEIANNVAPGDAALLRELVDLATELGDRTASARHLAALADASTGASRGNVLLELADVYYDKLDDAPAARVQMRAAADAFGAGARRDGALRMLASEASAHLAWHTAVDALSALVPDRRTAADTTSLATALMRAGRDSEAIAIVEAALSTSRFSDGGELLAKLYAEAQRKAELARVLEERAQHASSEDAEALRDEARGLLAAIGEPGPDGALRPGDARTEDSAVANAQAWEARTKTLPGTGDDGPVPAGPDEEPRLRESSPSIGRIKLVSRAASRGSSPAVLRVPDPNATPTQRPGTQPRFAIPRAAAEEASGAVADPAGAPDSGPNDAAVPKARTAEPDTARGAGVTSNGPVRPSSPRIEIPPREAAQWRAMNDSYPEAIADPSSGDTQIADVPTEVSAPIHAPSVTITGTQAETATAVALAAAFADRDLLLSARRNHPDDPALLLALLAHLGDREPALRAEVLDDAARRAHGTALAIALHEQALTARESHEPARAHALLTRAYSLDSTYAPIWMPLADALAASDDTAAARDLYERIAASSDYADDRRAFAASRAEALGRDDTVVSGEIGARPSATPALVEVAADRAPDDIAADEPVARTAEPAADVAPVAVEPVAVAADKSAADVAPVAVESETVTTDESVARTTAPAADVVPGSVEPVDVAADEPAAPAAESASDILPSDPPAVDSTNDAPPSEPPVTDAPDADAARATSDEPATTILPAGDPVALPRTSTPVAQPRTFTAPDPASRSAAAYAALEPFARAEAAPIAEAPAPLVPEPPAPLVAEPPPAVESAAADLLAEARRFAEREDWPAAIAAAERAVSASAPESSAALEALEQLYFEAGDLTAATDSIGRQLLLVEDPARRAVLWLRRARLYREQPGKDADAYRALKEAHDCAPADPDIAYQLRTAAMVRDEWTLAASLLYREIAAAATPRDRGALHLELALVYDERIADEAQAQVHYEQALAFDPTIPAAKLPLARRYAAIGRFAEAAKLYEEAAAFARAGDRAALLDAAAKCRTAATDASSEPDLAAQLDRAEAAGDAEAAEALAHQLWAADPGHAAAFRVLATGHRASGDLDALSALTRTRAQKAEAPEERATAWLDVARLAEELGALDQAARAFDLALIADPGHVGALDARGALAFRLGDFATADLIYRDLGTGESVLGDDELALRRSIIVEHLGREPEALAHAQAAAAAAPGRRDVVMRVQELATRIGDLDTALAAARTVLDLVPLDDDESQLAVHFAVVELLRQRGDLDAAVAQLERILRDQPQHAAAIEALADVHVQRGDWPTATRYLYQLVPLAPSPGERAERLYRLGEAVHVHLGDIDRADDVFLRASDLDPAHAPTLRRLIDVYWRADDPAALVEVAADLAKRDALGPGGSVSLARALVAAAILGDQNLAERLSAAGAGARIADALAELAGRTAGRLQLSTASTAISELAKRGIIKFLR